MALSKPSEANPRMQWSCLSSHENTQPKNVQDQNDRAKGYSKVGLFEEHRDGDPAEMGAGKDF